MTENTTMENTAMMESGASGGPGVSESGEDGREAAKYRRRLREVEAERDALVSRAEAAQRTLVEHLARSQGRIKPEALWASGVSLEALAGEDGNVDPVKVVQACDQAAALLGLSRSPKPDRSQGVSSGRLLGFTDAFGPDGGGGGPYFGAS